jgi:predicted DNA-binding transcriptional regulator YafY
VALGILTYNETYYMIAYDEGGQFKHYSIKNMEDLSLSKKYALDVASPTFDNMTYKYEHPYVIEGEPVKISLLIKPYLKQELAQLCGRFVMFSLSGNDEFPIKATVTSTAAGMKKWALSNLGNCCVVSPEHLREEMRETMKADYDQLITITGEYNQ